MTDNKTLALLQYWNCDPAYIESSNIKISSHFFFDKTNYRTIATAKTEVEKK